MLTHVATLVRRYFTQLVNDCLTLAAAHEQYRTEGLLGQLVRDCEAAAKKGA